MKNLILTDVDGTLTRKSVVLSHAGFLIEKGIIKDDGSFKAWKKDVKNESLIVAVAENYRNEITGKTEEEMKAKEFVTQFLENEKNWYQTLNDLKEKISQGFEVVLVTGSSDFLIKHLANFLGCSYYATEYLKADNCFTGKVKGMFSESQKDDCIQWNINTNEYNYIEAWGDTASDFGLFKHADYRLLVEPTKQTLETLIKKITIDKII